jgi:hypothetical protein
MIAVKGEKDNCLELNYEFTSYGFLFAGAATGLAPTTTATDGDKARVLLLDFDDFIKSVSYKGPSEDSEQQPAPGEQKKSQ